MEPLKVFIIYSAEDRQCRTDLLKFLRHLEINDKIKIWTDQEIKPGDVMDEAIQRNLESAEIILPIVSVDFVNSDYIQGVEFRAALERRNKGEALVIPILAKECPWESYEDIKNFQPLPADKRPVERWPSQNEAYTHIAKAIEYQADKMRATKVERERRQLAAQAEDALRKANQAEQLAREGFLKAEAERKARELEGAKHQVEITKAQTELHQANNMRMSLVKSNEKVVTRLNIARMAGAAVGAAFLISAFLGYTTFTKSRKLQETYEELITQTGKEVTDKTAKSDSLANFIFKFNNLSKEHAAMQISIFEKALNLYEEDLPRFSTEPDRMKRAKAFIESLGIGGARESREDLLKRIEDAKRLK